MGTEYESEEHKDVDCEGTEYPCKCLPRHICKQ